MEKIVLLADDDRDDFEIFRDALEEARCEARMFRVVDGAYVFRFLESADNPRPDIIFLDLNMPVMNGWQCLAKLKNTEKFADIPVVMYTTSSNLREFEIASDLKAHGLITKPSDPKVLVQVIKRIVCSLGTQDLKHAIREAYLITHE